VGLAAEAVVQACMSATKTDAKESAGHAANSLRLIADFEGAFGRDSAGALARWRADIAVLRCRARDLKWDDESAVRSTGDPDPVAAILERSRQRQRWKGLLLLVACPAVTFIAGPALDRLAFEVSWAALGSAALLAVLVEAARNATFASCIAVERFKNQPRVPRSEHREVLAMHRTVWGHALIALVLAAAVSPLAALGWWHAWAFMAIAVVFAMAEWLMQRAHPTILLLARSHRASWDLFEVIADSYRTRRPANLLLTDASADKGQPKRLEMDSFRQPPGAEWLPVVRRLMNSVELVIVDARVGPYEAGELRTESEELIGSRVLPKVLWIGDARRRSDLVDDLQRAHPEVSLRIASFDDLSDVLSAVRRERVSQPTSLPDRILAVLLGVPAETLRAPPFNAQLLLDQVRSAPQEDQRRDAALLVEASTWLESIGDLEALAELRMV
jgi:hypothetical protein